MGNDLRGAYRSHKIPVHVAIDLETLDTRPSAAVVSVGLAAFTVTGGLIGSYYGVFETKPQTTDGRTRSKDTMAWWEEQPEDVRSVLTDPAAVPPVTGLRHVDSFFSRFQNNTYCIEGVWGFGSDFDNATLIDMFATYSIELPWHYKANRCGRTLVGLVNVPKPPSKGTHHNALDDAVWQAEWFRAALHRLEAKT